MSITRNMARTQRREREKMLYKGGNRCPKCHIPWTEKHGYGMVCENCGRIRKTKEVPDGEQ